MESAKFQENQKLSQLFQYYEKFREPVVTAPFLYDVFLMFGRNILIEVSTRVFFSLGSLTKQY